MIRRPPRSPLFPYTRSSDLLPRAARIDGDAPFELGSHEFHHARDAIDSRCAVLRSEEHTSELQSLRHLVCRLLLEKKKTNYKQEQQTLRYVSPNSHGRVYTN